MNASPTLLRTGRWLAAALTALLRPSRTARAAVLADEPPEEQGARYARLIRASLDTIVELSADGAYVWLSPNVEDVFGYRPAEMIGRSAFDLVHPEDRDRCFEIFARAVATRAPAEAVFRFRHANGDWRWVESRGKSFLHRGAIGVSVFSRDITETLEQQLRLAHLAHHDPLTGLPNRMLFEDRLEQAIATAGRTGECLGLAYVDLDFFKNINDSLGHLAGDQVLKAVARRFVANLRPGDTVTRLGGDEFVLILTGMHRAADCTRVAHGARTLFERPIAVEGDLLGVTASVGLAVWPRDGRTGDELLRAADHALYVAKSRGRDGFHEYEKTTSTGVIGPSRANVRIFHSER